LSRATDIRKAKDLKHNRPTVCVIEDDPAVRNSLKFALELEGYSVRLYPDAPAVLRANDQPEPTCIVVDLKLPGMNGLDLLDELRRRKITAPAVLITSHPSAGTLERATREGIAVIEKPLLGNALSDGIRKVIEHAPR
jgi:two-component system response regulator FixJ